MKYLLLAGLILLMVLAGLELYKIQNDRHDVEIRRDACIPVGSTYR